MLKKTWTFSGRGSSTFCAGVRGPGVGVTPRARRDDGERGHSADHVERMQAGQDVERERVEMPAERLPVEELVPGHGLADEERDPEREGGAEPSLERRLVALANGDQACLNRHARPDRQHGREEQDARERRRSSRRPVGHLGPHDPERDQRAGEQHAQRDEEQAHAEPRHARSFGVPVHLRVEHDPARGPRHGEGCAWGGAGCCVIPGA